MQGRKSECPCTMFSFFDIESRSHPTICRLLCLVRAILPKNKILVLDEPTANVDNQTDKLLQEAIATNFGCATILAIAQRLDTVIDYDKILVLGSEGVLDYGSPDLIASGGEFSKMLDEAAGMAANMLKASTTTQTN